jgi:hypothetical protein
MKTRIKMTLAVAIFAIGMASSASASVHGVSTYYDTIRPHGHPRSDAIYNAAVNACYDAARESRTALHDTPAFKTCMLSRGYRFENTQVVQDAPRAAPSSVAERSYTGPSVTITIGGSYDEDPEPTVDLTQQAAEQTADDINASIAQANGMQ